MKLSEFKEMVIEIYGKEAWEEIEESYIYKIYTAPEEEQLQVVKEDGYDIEYINNPSEKIKLEAVKENGLAIRYVKNPSEKVIQESIKGFGMNNTYKLKYMLKFLENDL